MATSPDQWLDKTTWTQLAASETFCVQVLEGAACLSWSTIAPTEDYEGVRLGKGGCMTGDGPLWGKCAFSDMSTKISASTAVNTSWIGALT